MSEEILQKEEPRQVKEPAGADVKGAGLPVRRKR